MIHWSNLSAVKLLMYEMKDELTQFFFGMPDPLIITEDLSTTIELDEAREMLNAAMKEYKRTLAEND